MASRGWESKGNLEAIINEPLEGGQRSNLGFCTSQPCHLTLYRAWTLTIAILTGKPFHNPLKPMFPYIRDIAFPPLSPAAGLCQLPFFTSKCHSHALFRKG